MVDQETPASALQLYTAEQAAELLQVSPSWLRRKATARAIACTFVGKHLRFSTDDLKSIITAGAAGTASQQRRR
ncbi:helix-turn-helix domain-containing protein [Paractinoplanes globisporus]|uniref:Helix-turn-helix domain-containing protein n=1 Tax=Paractinoplanes globisporus TaxID=113565 RepID=A0ABW6WLK5_9ACTN|nr:helix-turn-helix domain-containing protein [Actinoplanes globisporus]